MEGMRKILLSAVTLCLLTVPLVRGAAQEDSEAAQVKALDFKLTEAYKQRKFDLLASLLDDDFVIIFEDGNVYGKTGYISFSATSTIKVDGGNDRREGSHAWKYSDLDRGVSRKRQR
jgi:hypothetical protein